MRKRPAQVLSQGDAGITSEGSRPPQPRHELLGTYREAEGLQLGGPARLVLPEQHEVPVVAHQNESVPAPVPAHLVAIRGQPGILGDRFHLHHTAFGSAAKPTSAGPEATSSTGLRACCGITAPHGSGIAPR